MSHSLKESTNPCPTASHNYGIRTRMPWLRRVQRFGGRAESFTDSNSRPTFFRRALTDPMTRTCILSHRRLQSVCAGLGRGGGVGGVSINSTGRQTLVRLRYTANPRPPASHRQKDATMYKWSQQCKVGAHTHAKAGGGGAGRRRRSRK